MADCECSSRRITFGVPYELLFANFKLVRSELKKWDGKTTIESNVSNAYYAIDEQTLPPGVKSNEIVTFSSRKRWNSIWWNFLQDIKSTKEISMVLADYLTFINNRGVVCFSP